jgi:hypothetical protein
MLVAVAVQNSGGGGQATRGGRACACVRVSELVQCALIACVWGGVRTRGYGVRHVKWVERIWRARYRLRLNQVHPMRVNRIALWTVHVKLVHYYAHDSQPCIMYMCIAPTHPALCRHALMQQSGVSLSCTHCRRVRMGVRGASQLPPSLRVSAGEATVKA